MASPNTVPKWKGPLPIVTESLRWERVYISASDVAILPQMCKGSFNACNNCWLDAVELPGTNILSNASKCPAAVAKVNLIQT